MDRIRLHHVFVQELATIGLGLSVPQCVNLAGLSEALAFSANCHLANLALGLPFAGQRENLIQRLRRLLKQTGMQPLPCYQPVVRHLFAHWPHRDINLVMDRTDLEHRWSILVLGAAYAKRLLPLAWTIWPHGASTAAQQLKLLRWVRPCLPQGPAVAVTYYGDAEFRAVDVQSECRANQWHWQVGLKSDLLYRTAAGPWQSLRSLQLRPGERRYLHDVFISQQKPFGPVDLLADWAPKQDAPRYWALDRLADGQAWRRGRKRYWIEPTFRDWKSYGFDLERSKLDDPARLNVLLLGLALTTLWLIHVGDWLVRSGRRAELAPTDQMDYSLFRLGRDYLQRATTMNQRIPVGFTVGAPA